MKIWKKFEELEVLYKEIKEEVRRRDKNLFERWKAGGFLIDTDIINMYENLRDVAEILDSRGEEEETEEDDKFIVDVKYPHIHVQLTGKDGNAFVILGLMEQALKKEKVPQGEIQEFRKEAMSGDYDHLLQTCMKWVSVS